jgi:hypothetical protein
MAVIPWTEIEGFHNIRKYAVSVPDILNGYPIVTYRGKVKLHGENHAIQIHNDGSIVCQSRGVVLTPEKDNKGFAKWVETIKAPLLASNANGFILYGEWCGKGIQSGVALEQLNDKVFALFAARSLNTEDGVLISEPTHLADLLSPVASELGIHILPWHNDPIQVDWSASDETLSAKTSLINEWVMAVEQNDPWVDSTFGIKGTGEGLVFYPTSVEHLGYANYCNLVFKAKGEAHRVVKAKVAAQVNAESAENANLFAGMVLTMARLEQGARAVSDDGSLTFNQKLIGKFLGWIATDVQKENQDELEASGLDWKQVQKPVGDKARGWYLSQMKK